MSAQPTAARTRRRGQLPRRLRRSQPPPLWMMARSNSPSDAGDARWPHTEKPPADSPKMVTLSGSPPNARCSRRTHSSPAAWSEAVVAEGAVVALVGERLVAQEPERPEPVVHVHHDHTSGRQVVADVELLMRRARRKPAAVDPEHDRQTLGVVGRPHADRETVVHLIGHGREPRQQRSRVLRTRPPGAVASKTPSYGRGAAAAARRCRRGLGRVGEGEEGPLQDPALGRTLARAAATRARSHRTCASAAAIGGRRSGRQQVDEELGSAGRGLHPRRWRPEAIDDRLATVQYEQRCSEEIRGPVARPRGAPEARADG